MKRKNKGITLIALVITVIILLILAAITINMTIGQRGIITRAREAGKNYQEAATREDEELAKLWNEAENILTGTTGGSSGGNTGGSGQDPVTPGGDDEKPWAQDPSNPDWSKPSTNTEKDNYTDETGKKATIPEGFQVSKKEGEDKIEDGLVVRDAETNNEFVWVPCTEDGQNGSIKYDRYVFGNQPAKEVDTATNSMKIFESATGTRYYTESMPMIQGTRTELDSIKQYGGFYIGRYEVGIINFDINTQPSSANWTRYINGTTVIQKGKKVWDYITRDKAKEISEGLYKDNNSIISRLCSSYSWDTALKFIETNNPSYETDVTHGNYKSSTFDYRDLNGELKTKAKDSAEVVPTGQTVPLSNIYDMGGNVFEWSTETASQSNFPCTMRGNSFGTDRLSVYPMGYRGLNTLEFSSSGTGFRITLYLK